MAVAKSIAALPIHDELLMAQKDQAIAKSVMEDTTREIVVIAMPVSMKVLSTGGDPRTASRVAMAPPRSARVATSTWTTELPTSAEWQESNLCSCAVTVRCRFCTLNGPDLGSSFSALSHI